MHSYALLKELEIQYYRVIKCKQPLFNFSNTVGHIYIIIPVLLLSHTPPPPPPRYCPQCKAHREATKQLLLWRLPRCLVVHLKRFSFHNPLFRNKLDKLVHFPLQ